MQGAIAYRAATVRERVIAAARGGKLWNQASKLRPLAYARGSVRTDYWSGASFHE